MWISRVRVTGGFLEGLDLQLARGLNVVIGPRGSGKTTLLELIRHAIGALHADASSERERQKFLKAVLEDGEVILDIETESGGQHLVVDARGGGQRSELTRSVLVLGQNELEEIASDAPSRLALLDLRADQTPDLPPLDEASNLTKEMWSIRQEIAERQEQALKRPILISDQAVLRSQADALVGQQDLQLRSQQEELAKIEEILVQSGQQLVEMAELDEGIEAESSAQQRAATNLQGLLDRARQISGTSLESRNELAVVSAQLESALGSLDATQKALTTARGALALLRTATQKLNLSARNSAAPLREELDKTEAGLGRITAQLRNINMELTALDENQLRTDALEQRYKALSETRRFVYARYETAQEELYSARAAIAKATSAEVSNNVVVVVDHLSDSSTFREALQRLLKGSNVRGSLIESIAERVLPRQLLELVETKDSGELAVACGTTTDRVQRVIEFLDAADALAELSALGVSDSVDFRLRDGSIDKGVEELSTGQKCAVTLPIILSERARTLILDQPEDHLDNRFLVKNIVAGLRRRRDSSAQTIVATHNANVPVLGEADEVVVLRSDGRRGSVDVHGRFEVSEVVDRITRLMEGGRDAFALRSSFYEKYGQVQAE